MQILRLIRLYFYCCQVYDTQLLGLCWRHTKNQQSPRFTDAELLTLYLHLLVEYRPASLRVLHRLASDHYRSWFPHLPGYERFCRRLHRLAPALPVLLNQLCGHWHNRVWPEGAWPIGDEGWLLTDSFPVVCCSGKRYGVVAPEVTDRGYCRSKRMSYWGVKVHVIARQHPGRLPVPVHLFVTPASEHDYAAQVTQLQALHTQAICGDKAFGSAVLRQAFASGPEPGVLLVSCKDEYRQRSALRHWNQAADEVYNRAVSKLRQPIESLFAYLQQGTGIQQASLVRSTAGLTLHLFGKLCAAVIAQLGDGLFG